MKIGGFRHGFGEADWERATTEAREVMYSVAKQKRDICYSDLVARIKSITLDAHDVRLDHFLGEIATEDDDDGIGLTSVVVVHKNGDKMPGRGFFEMAESQGRDATDEVACWVEELNAVYDYWATK